MKLVAAISILVFLASCSPQKKAAPSKLSGVPSQAASVSLIGEWTSCENYPQGELIGIKSASITYNFQSETTMTMSASYYADEGCNTKFTKLMAVDYFKQYEDINRSPAPGDVTQSVFDLAEGIRQEIPYRADKVLENQVGTIDFLSMERPSYTSFRIAHNELKIASVCHDLIEEGCDPIGDKPDNRATDTLDGDTLIKRRKKI